MIAAPLVLVLALATHAQDAAGLERQLVAATQATPDSFAAQHALGEFYLQAGRLADAVPALERARALDPAHYANGYHLARAYLETGRIADAEAQVRRMLATGQTAQLNHLMGDIAVRAGDRKLAATAYQLAARLEPTEAYLFAWGDNLLQLGAHADAADVFTAAGRRHPASARIQIGLGIAQYARGQYEDAVRSFTRATDLAPSDPNAYGFLGEMYGVVPDPDGHIVARMARFVELQPQSAAAHFFHAMHLWQREGDVDLGRVETLLRTAVSLDGTHAKARLQLGILLSQQRRWKEAIAELEAAVRLAPEMPQPHFRLAHAYRRDGQTARADEELAIFERLKASDPAAGRPE